MGHRRRSRPAAGIRLRGPLPSGRRRHDRPLRLRFELVLNARAILIGDEPCARNGLQCGTCGRYGGRKSRTLATIRLRRDRHGVGRRGAERTRRGATFRRATGYRRLGGFRTATCGVECFVAWGTTAGTAGRTRIATTALGNTGPANIGSPISCCACATAPGGTLATPGLRGKMMQWPRRSKSGHRLIPKVA